ncbi:MAG: helix-turn-helix domain-containing protein [Gammaproteobacteria bacterium]|nr:helix-turn-helix domain-containing protein [Gammaproteobacteria bacterium]
MEKKMFNEMLESVREMDKILKGKKRPSRKFIFKEPKVKNIRKQTGLSQTDFAQLIGVSKRTLDDSHGCVSAAESMDAESGEREQGRRSPTGPARVLLKIVETDPEGALRALHG